MFTNKVQKEENARKLKQYHDDQMMNKKAQIQLIRSGEKELGTIKGMVEERNKQNANLIKAEGQYLKKVKESQDKNFKRRMQEK